MPSAIKVLGGCLAVPVLLVASCTGKMYYDSAVYNLPGEILKSHAAPTRTLESAIHVAEALDSYVQPRFEILRDKDFGAIRITYRKHAGVVQLKVESPEEKKIIANVNAANRDYAISLLHCAPKPPAESYDKEPALDLLYFNQKQFVTDSYYIEPQARSDKTLDFPALQKQARTAMPRLMAGSEFRTTTADWEVLMRPVPARQKCLSCHTEAKSGDTLGVMVYAVRNTKRGNSAAISRR